MADSHVDMECNIDLRGDLLYLNVILVSIRSRLPFQISGKGFKTENTPERKDKRDSCTL